MLSGENSLPLINSEQPLTTNKSLKLIQAIRINNKKNLSKKQTKKIDDTSRSISMTKTKTNISNEKENIKFRSSKKKKNSILNIKIKSSYRNNSTKGKYLLFKNMLSLSSSEEKNNSKLKNNKEKNNINIVEESSELKTFYYKLFKNGNDISTIKKCFEHRKNWQIAPESHNYNEMHFIWAPLSCQIKYDQINQENTNTKIITLINHYEYHAQLSN